MVTNKKLKIRMDSLEKFVADSQEAS